MIIIGLVVLVIVAVIALRTGSRDDAAGRDQHQTGVRAGGPSGAVTEAQLDLVGGTDSLTITTASLGGDLVQAATPLGARAVPVLQMTADSRVLVSTREATAAGHGDGPVDLVVRLARGVRWGLLVDGGSQLIRLDLAQAQLSSLDITQGVATLDAVLPRLPGALTFRMSGGASAVRLHLPPNVPARVTFSSGGGTANVAGQQRQGLAAGTVMATSDWPDAAGSKIDVQLDAGIGSLVASY